LILYFIKDKISAISLSVGAILIGITIDYALHILTHYKHNNNIEELYKEITQPIILSSATTAVSFLCLVFVRSEALKDLGLFAAITVILSSVTALIIVPQLYHPKKKKKQSIQILSIKSVRIRMKKQTFNYYLFSYYYCVSFRIQKCRF
jgi:predicted RND superfamily exporter protein